MKAKNSNLLIVMLVFLLLINLSYFLLSQSCWTFNCWLGAERRCSEWCPTHGEGWYCASFDLETGFCLNLFCYQIFNIVCQKVEERNGIIWIFVKSHTYPCSGLDEANCPPPPK